MNAMLNLALPTLLGLLLKSTLLLSAAALACHLLNRASAATRHLIWSAALIGVLLLPLLSMAVPHWNVAWNHAATSSPVPQAPVLAPLPAAPATRPAGSPSDPPGTHLTEVAASDDPQRQLVSTPAVWAVAGLTIWLTGALVVLAHLAVA